jgi:hypothetical protein
MGPMFGRVFQGVPLVTEPLPPDAGACMEGWRPCGSSSYVLLRVLQLQRRPVAA